MPTASRSGWSRREAIGLIGAGGAGVASLWWGGTHLGAQPPASAAIIRTVLDDVPPDALGDGATLFHEHLSMTDEFVNRLLPQGAPPLTRMKFFDDLDLIADEVQAAGADGVSCIVDGGHPDMGRSLEALREIATRSGVHVVAGGGYYRQATYPPEVASKSEDQLADELVRDAHAERWGALGEIGTSSTLTSDERKVLRAVGKSHLRTGLAIFTHTPYHSGGCHDEPGGGTCALQQLDAFESVGVDPLKLCIGHLSDLDEPGAETAKSIASRGAFVGFDTVGRPMRGNALPESKKLRMVLAVLEAGHEDRVLLSEDLGDENWLKSVGGCTSKSAVSRRFVAQTQAQLDAWRATPLDDLELVALLIAGVHVGGHCIVVALGLDKTGAKHPLGLWEGSAENTTVCQGLLTNLQSRGLRTDRSPGITMPGA